MARRVRLLAAAGVALTSIAGAQVTTYTAASLGYPVPTPVNTTEPFAGFRVYDAIVMKHLDLATSSPNLSRSQAGVTTEFSRPIWAYVIGDADDVGVDGTKEPGLFISGGMHAREWCGPEIVSQYLEQLVQNYGTDPIATYLVDQNHAVVIPIVNVDGVLQTQTWFNKEYQSIDGRMRRKNMRDVDAQLEATLSDNSFGVDLNRNSSVGFGGGSSSSPTSSVYRGSTSFSELETQCVRDAVSLFAAPSQLRVMFDVHGAIPIIYRIVTNNTSVDAAATQLSQRMRSTYDAFNGFANSYPEDPLGTADYWGGNDAYWGLTYNIPAYTIEYPTPRYREGGFGPTFITPDSEVTRIVEENISALMLASLFAAGPPIVEKVTVWRDADSDGVIGDGETCLVSQWAASTPGGSARTRTTQLLAPIEFGSSYRVLLQFNKPMRRDAAGSPALWVGQTGSTAANVRVPVALAAGGTQDAVIAAVGGGWQRDPGTATTPGYARYRYDSWLGTLDLVPFGDGAAADQSAALRITAGDLYGFALDARPATLADWNAGWVGFENENGAGTAGGTDNTLSLNLTRPVVTGVTGWTAY